MARIRAVAHIGIISFSEFLQRKAQAYVPGDPTALSPVEDLAIGNIFTPEQKQIIENPTSLADLKRVIDEFPEIMNEAVNQINMLPAEKYLQGEYFLNSLLEYFDQVKFLYEALQESAQMQTAPETEINFLEPEFEKEEPWVWDEERPAEFGTTPSSIEELTKPIDVLESAVADLQSMVTSVSTDDIAYSPSMFKNKFLDSINDLVTKLNSLTPVIETAFDAFA